MKVLALVFGVSFGMLAVYGIHIMIEAIGAAVAGLVSGVL